MSPASGIMIHLTYLLLILPSLSLNVTIPLLKSHNFSIFTSLLAETHLDNDIQTFTSTGMTMLIPIDQAFFNLTRSGYNRYQKLTFDQKYTLVKAHLLPAYYTLTSLQSVTIFMQPTLATQDKGPQTFLLNISGINGSAHIDTGIVRGFITRTVYDHKPNVIYGVSKILLPPELFGRVYVDAASPYHPPSSGFFPLPMVIISFCLLI